jgi:hypothetical protein
MNRWAPRVIGILMVLVLLFLLMNLQKKLIEIAKERGVDTTTAK